MAIRLPTLLIAKINGERIGACDARMESSTLFVARRTGIFRDERIQCCYEQTIREETESGHFSIPFNASRNRPNIYSAVGQYFEFIARFVLAAVAG